MNFGAEFETREISSLRFSNGEVQVKNPKTIS